MRYDEQARAWQPPLSDEESKALLSTSTRQDTGLPALTGGFVCHASGRLIVLEASGETPAGEGPIPKPVYHLVSESVDDFVYPGPDQVAGIFAGRLRTYRLR